MIVIKDTVVSDEILDNFFVCDLVKCKGACCVEGDLGAPLGEDELQSIKDVLPDIEPYLSGAGIEEIRTQGPYVKDFEGDYSTPTIHGRECAYSVYDEDGILRCGFELAWNDGKTGFRKPISCHLYPVRIKKNKVNSQVNYHRWHICSPACDLGKAMKIPLYIFVKDALVRKFGEEWYLELEAIARKRSRASNNS
ncbi:MAG TPA: DUF3109 family protein [Cyclobacteriaceae bacterium]|nr:DUF3109 family protein [Cyclobacteriaceae bacterium]